MGRKVWVPTPSGPLAPFAAGFAVWLRSRSYSPSAMAKRLLQLEQLSRWLERCGLSLDELTEARAAEFASSRREAGLVSWSSPQSVDLPLKYLRGIGVIVPAAPAVADGPLEELLAEYRRYLFVERRLCEHTVVWYYVPTAGLFLAGRQGPDGLELERLSAADVSRFLAAECPKRSVSGARGLASALRSLLRFLHVTGLIELPLVWAVPPVANRRDSSLPRGLEPAAVKKLLASCDRRRTVGRRDYAVLLLLSRLGLRRGEVAAIQLEDINWRDGELLIHGKCGVSEFATERSHFSNPTLSAVAGLVGECAERARRRPPCRVPPPSVPAGDPLKSAPLPQVSVDAIGAAEVAHFLLARFCLIRSVCARRMPAMRARRMPGPRP